MSQSANVRRGAAGTVVVIVLALIVVAGGLWFFLLRSTPERTMASMLEAARAGDQPAMRAHLTERSSDDGLVVTLTRRLTGGPEGEPRYSVGEAQIEEDRATVTVTFPLGPAISAMTGRDSLTVPYVLHREDGQWLVDERDTAAAAGREITGGATGLMQDFLVF